MLVVGLLQDGAEEVREDMATSVGIILSSLAPSVGMSLFVCILQIPFVWTGYVNIAPALCVDRLLY